MFCFQGPLKPLKTRSSSFLLLTSAAWSLSEFPLPQCDLLWIKLYSREVKESFLEFWGL